MLGQAVGYSGEHGERKNFCLYPRSSDSNFVIMEREIISWLQTRSIIKFHLIWRLWTSWKEKNQRDSRWAHTSWYLINFQSFSFDITSCKIINETLERITITLTSVSNWSLIKSKSLSKLFFRDDSKCLHWGRVEQPTDSYNEFYSNLSQ